MATQASTLLLLAIVVGLASFASYLLSQWRARQGRDTFALAGIGIGTALLLAAVFMLVLGMMLFSQQWFSRLNESASRNEDVARDLVSRPNPFEAVTIEPSGELGPQSDREHDSRPLRRHEASAPGEPYRQHMDKSSARANAAPSPLPIAPSARREQDRGMLSASDPWGATRCVVPLKREWAEGTRWTIVNDCGVAVAIVIATCGQPASACSKGAWRYPIDGLHLPAKIQRPTTEAEETQHATELRHAACVVTDPTALDLIGIHPQDRTEQWQHDLERARARDICLHEVRRLTALGARSGVPLEALLGGALLSRAGQ